MNVGENIVLRVQINGKVKKEGVRNSINVGAWLKTVLSDHNLMGDYFIDHEGRVVDKSVSIARAGLFDGAEIRIRPVAVSLPPPPGPGKVAADASVAPPVPRTPHEVLPTTSEASPSERAPPPATVPPRRQSHLASLIAVFIEGEKNNCIPIQPLIRIIVHDSSIVKLTRIAFKRKGCGAPLEQQKVQPCKVPQSFLVTLPNETFLDFDQDYKFEVSCRPNDSLSSSKATYDFHTAPQRSLPSELGCDSESTEQSQPVALSYADVRLMTQDFDSTEEAVASRATGRLGKGAFAVVSKGLFVGLSFAAAASEDCYANIAAKRVAVKRLAPSGTITMRHVQDTVRRELVALRNMRHKNIVRLLAYAEHPSVAPRKKGRSDAVDYYYDEALADVEQFPCLVYEYLPLGSLDQLLMDDARARNISWRNRLNILMGIAQGLTYLHSLQPAAFHRDIKSANIALDLDYTPKLIDWGLARFRSETVAGVETAIGTVMGTAVYICPQYQNRDIEYEARCDIYSYGVVVLELLTGRVNGRPWRQGRRTHFQLEQNEQRVPDSRCGIWPPEVVSALKTIAAKCMQLHVTDRYSSMQEVIDVLLQAERESVRLQPNDQELEERIFGLQRELEELSLQHHVRERVEWMRKQHRAMEEIGRRLRCCGSACAEEYAAADEGIACPFIPDHFFCDDCFDKIVREQITNEKELCAAEFRLCCPVCRANDYIRPFPFQAVAKHTTDDTFCLFLAQREALKVKAERLKGEYLLEQRMQDLEIHAEQSRHHDLCQQEERYIRDVSVLTDRITDMAGKLEEQEQRRAAEEQRRAEDERLRIEAERKRRLQVEANGHKVRIEELLKMRCPHCQGGITETTATIHKCLSWQHVDSDGSGGGCGGYFCGLCFTACSSSDLCHQHVVSCALNPNRGGLFVPDMALRSKARAPARKERIARYLSENVKDAEVRALLVASLAPILERHSVEL